MEFSLHFQKLCHVETRRLILVMGTVASLVLIIQFYLLPYGNVLLSLFPSGMVPLLGKSSFPAGDSSPNSSMVSSLNKSTSTDSSMAREVVNNTGEFDIREETGHVNEAKEKEGGPINGLASEGRGPDNAFELDKDIETDNNYSPEKIVDLDKNSRFENAKNPYNGSISEKTWEAEQDSSLEQGGKSENDFSSDNVRKENTNLTLEKTESDHTGSMSPTLVLPPIVSPINLTSQREIDANKSTSVREVNFNIPSAANQAVDMLSKDEKPELLKNGPATSKDKSIITSNRVKKGNWWEMPPTSVTSISEMSRILLQSRASSHSMKPQWSSVRDQEILSAKSQIENAPIIKNDRELYAPLFRNVSTFKRSYELMESILKVYVYREGDQPIFHRPIQKGIYASEGWFMKQMEGNRRFTVKNPKKAHLFYLPFSTRMLEVTLYVPNSHSHKNLIKYLKNYLDTISGKYPFWNRTGGADHFLVACHDWAPSETKQHMANCIRALCNADVNGGFAIGKDVSLPETYIRVAKNPLRDLGGKPPGQRQILAFFAGSMHGYLRPILLQYWENKDPDMKIYGRIGSGSKNKMNYVQYMKNSKYCICAKGYEVNSPRVVEAIFYECVPVIISDNYVPPFFEVLDWEAFAVFVLEKDIPNLKDILLSIPEKRYQTMQMRVKKVQQHFLWHTKPVKYDIFHMILHSIWYNRVFQIEAR